MRVVQLGCMASRAGAGVTESVRGLSSGLSQLCEVSIMASAARGHDSKYLLWGDTPVCAYPAWQPEGFAFSPTLQADIEAMSADLLHVHGLWTYASWVSWRWARRAAPRRYIVSTHGMLNESALAISRWKKRIATPTFQERQLNAASCLHALCEPELNAIRKQGFRGPVCVIPNGVDVGVTSTDEPPPWAQLVPSDSKVLLYLGRIHPIKNLDTLVNAWASIDHARDWHMVLAGWGPTDYVQQLRQLAAERAPGRVHFVGATYGTAKVSALQNADAFVMPSLSEGVPVSVLEAWAHRLPVAMTQGCNLGVGFERDAALQLPGSAREMGHTLNELTNVSASKLKQMGENGRALVEQRYSWDRIAHEMFAVYRWVLGMGPRPNCVEG